jgi:hypothetical protein
MGHVRKFASKQKFIIQNCYFEPLSLLAHWQHHMPISTELKQNMRDTYWAGKVLLEVVFHHIPVIIASIELDLTMHGCCWKLLHRRKLRSLMRLAWPTCSLVTRSELTVT